MVACTTIGVSITAKATGSDDDKISAGMHSAGKVRKGGWRTKATDAGRAHERVCRRPHGRLRGGCLDLPVDTGLKLASQRMQHASVVTDEVNSDYICVAFWLNVRQVAAPRQPLLEIEHFRRCRRAVERKHGPERN